MVAWLASDEALHVTGQVFRAVGANIAHYEPWQLGGQRRQSQGRRQVGPGDIAAEVNAQIFHSRHPGLKIGRRADPCPTSPGGHRRRLDVRLRARRRQDRLPALNYQGTTPAPWPTPASTVPRSTASCRSTARCRRSSWPSTSASGPTGWTRRGTAAASGSSWSSTPRRPSPRALVEVVVLTYGSTQRADLKKKLRMANLSFGTRGPIQFAAPFGHPVGSHYAMVARRHMHEFGTTIEQLAEMAVSTRYNAGLNPDAYYHDPITIDDVMNSPHDLGPADQAALLHPLRRRWCHRADPRGPGQGLCQRARSGCSGTGEAVSHTTMSEWEDFTESPCVRSGALAFERAGVTPEDIDVVAALRRLHPHGAPHAGGPGLLQEGRGRPVRRGRHDAGGRRVADQHRRRRPLVVPARHARPVPAD